MKTRMTNKIYDLIVSNKELGKKSIAVLIDPDKLEIASLDSFINSIELNEVDYIFYGGSLILSSDYEQKLVYLKSKLKIPIVLFPGNSLHLNSNADGILLLSLISGRNPEYLIGQHVIAAPHLKKSGLEILSTSYLLIDSGTQTTVSYISNTTPIPNNKPEIAACTALAGEQLGMKLIYLDGGSGAKIPVSKQIIKSVKNTTSNPLIVGGGINTPAKATEALEAGADIIVIGNALETNQDLLNELSKVIKNFNYTLA
jgi:phosphoglycerol geranylgeranyltransferase